MNATPNIFLWISRLTTILSQCKGNPYDIKCSQKWLKLKFCWFQRLGSNFTSGSHRFCSTKKGVYKNFAIFTGKYPYQSIYLNCNFIKNKLWHRGFLVNFARSLRTPSILQQLLALYFANIYSWHVLSSEMSIVGKINLSTCFKNFTDFDFFYTDFFFHFLLRKAYAVFWAANRFCLETPKYNAFNQFWKLKFHFEHFPRDTRFLSFDRDTYI